MKSSQVYVAVCCLIVVVAPSVAQSVEGQSSPVASGRTCDSFRQEMAALFQQAYDKVPSLLPTMMDAAQDPSTGKRSDLNLDTLKSMIVNTLTSLLPPCVHSQRKDHTDVARHTDPPVYITKLYRSMVPQARYLVKGSSHKRVAESVPEKIRRKRSSGSSDAKLSSDFLTIGEAHIPLELFQHPDKGNEEEEHNQITLELYV